MQTNFRVGLAIVSVVFGAVFASPALAADKAASAHPDFSGFWQLSGREKPSEISKELLDALPKDVVVLDDVGAPEYSAGNFGGLKPTAEAQEIIKKWDPKSEYKPRNVCRSPSIIYSMQGPFPIEIDQAHRLMVIHLEFFDLFRIVYLDGRPHPGPKQPHSLNGHSVGHWEGDTLVVDTTHLKAATLTGNGLEHSDKVHLIERFKVSADGNTLWGTQMFEDPVMLKNRGARLIAWKKVPGQHVYPYECDPFEYSGE